MDHLPGMGTYSFVRLRSVLCPSVSSITFLLDAHLLLDVTHSVRSSALWLSIFDPFVPFACDFEANGFLVSVATVI